MSAMLYSFEQSVLGMSRSTVTTLRAFENEVAGKKRICESRTRNVCDKKSCHTERFDDARTDRKKLNCRFSSREENATVQSGLLLLALGLAAKLSKISTHRCLQTPWPSFRQYG